jgi:signal transduction histidine kinase
VAASTGRHRRRTLAEQFDRVVGYFQHAEPQPALSRAAFRADVAIAVAVTIAALVAAIHGYLLVHGGNIAARPSRPPGIPPQPPPPGHLLPALTAGQPIHTWALVFVVLTTAPLAFRRRYPIGAFCTILVAIIITSSYLTVVTIGSAIFAAYCAVVYSRNRRLALLVLAGGAVTLAAAYPHVTPEVPERYTALLVLVPTAAVGNMMRVWRRRAGESAERLRRAQAEHEADTLRALDLERARIASELHDVVTHNVSVMVVQAGAARRVLESSPDEAEAARTAREALLAVEASGRNAMTDLRHLLGLLAPASAEQVGGAGALGLGDAAGPGAADVSPVAGPADGSASFRPQPSVAQIPALLGRVCSAGLPVELNVIAPAGTPRPLPPGVDLVVYRVVQEALTNVIKYAPQARTVVRLEYRPRELRVTVSNEAADTGLRSGPPPVSGGRGLLGLRERVAIYGGDLDAGPRPGGGWRVGATIPLESVADGEGEVQVIRTEFQATSS